MEFTHAVGYRGICAIKAGTGQSGSSPAQKGDLVPLLCTGGSVSLTQDPIQSSGVWGAGYANIAPVAFAFNYLNLEGSANFELTTKHRIPVSYHGIDDPDVDGPANAEQGVWNQLRAMAFTGRTNPDNTILMYPDGVNGFHNCGWLSSLGFDASEGAAVTGNFNFKGDPGLTSDGSAITCNDNAGNYENTDNDYDENDDGGTAASGLDDYHSNTGYWSLDKRPTMLVGGTLVPYWETYVVCDQDPVPDIISWSCSYSSDLQFLKCCNKRPDDADDFYPIAADYIMCGEMSCDGTITMFRLREVGKTNPDGTPDTNYVPFAGFSGKGLHSKKKKLKFMVGGNHIIVPMALVSQASTSMTTGASYITTEYSFTGYGDGIHSIMSMSVEQ